MKKLLLILLVFIGAMSIEDAKAQNATGNASDHGVPVPVSTPQALPIVGINTPPLTVPSAPPLQVIAPPVLTATPTISGSAILPAVPSAPVPPPAPAPGTPPPGSSFAKTLTLPSVPILPPLPPLPSMPDVRVAIGSN